MAITRPVEMKPDGTIVLDPELRQAMQTEGWIHNGVGQLKATFDGQMMTLVPVRSEELHAQFLRTPMGQYVLAHADPKVTLEHVLRITSRIKGSLTADAIALREDER